MATVTPPAQERKHQEARQRVHHPLQRLRGYIRLYIAGEGLAVLILYLALWFWIGLLLDFGIFKAFTVDWVQVLPADFRAIVLGALVVGLLVLVVIKMVLRLLREFRERALALVLERRFPELLGDRLITAVELADPAIARRYGYSRPLIEQTIFDAAERVGQVPLDQVFNWRRLRRHGIAAAICTLGIYLLVGLGYCIAAKASPGSFFVRFNTVATIWFERNILLHQVIWPRRALLELVNFPDSGELRIGRNAPPPTLRVRALKWVIADRKMPEGWRALHWSDLKPELLGMEIPTDKLSAEWRGWTLDHIELQLDKPETQDNLDADTILTLRNVFEHLETVAGSPRMERRLRQLVIPESIGVLYQGETIQSEQKLQKQNDYEYAGTVLDLRESVRFTVHGEDYYTPFKQITLVPPPTLVELTRDEYRPAYLYHRLTAGSDASELKGKKQEFKDLPASLGGSASHLDVPAGTDVVLRARTDKQLKLPGGVRLKDSSESTLPIKQRDGRSFEVQIRNVVTPIDFVFEFTDTDNVVGWRQVVIKPIEDTPPEVDVLVEVIRKTNQGYLVTPLARVPFSGKVRDDHGLENVEYAYTLTRVDSQAGAAAATVLSALQLTPLLTDSPQLTAGYLTWLGLVSKATTEESKGVERIALSSFSRRLRERAAEDVAPGGLAQRLMEKPTQTLLKDFTLDPADEFFDIEKLGLQSSDDRQPHYRLRLGVVATDNNVETGPGVGQSKERFTFLIVTENELLAEIAKEEESLHLKLEDTVNRLKESRGKLDQVMQELPQLKAEEFSPMARRAEEIGDVAAKGWDFSREIHTDYRRILKELQVNRVQPGIISRVEKNICEPLEGAINQEFGRADESIRAFQKTLEDRKADAKAAEQARLHLDELIERLNHVLDAMGDVTTINKLIALLVEVEKGERKEVDRLKKMRDELQEKILDDVLTPSPKKDGKP